MATIRLVPSAYAVSSTSYLSVSNPSNAYTNTDSTNYATVTNTYASTSSRYYYLRGFNFNDIPANATINSFTVKIKGYERGLSTSASYAPRLANGTSAISNTTASSNFGTSVSTKTIPTGSLTWQQIVNYGSNFTIMVYVRRNSRNTTGYFYCYGAEIEVNYTVPTQYYIDINRHGLSGMQIQSEDHSGTTYIIDDTNTSVDFPINEGTNFVLYINNTNSATFVLACNSVLVTPVNQGGNIWMYSIPNINDDYSFDVFTPLYVQIESEIQTITYNYCNICSTDISNKYATWAGFNVYTEWSGDITNYTITDNGVDVKASTSYNTSGGQYIISNIQTNHNVIITTGQSKVFIKVNGQWKEAQHIYVKNNNTWKDISTVYKKVNGAWESQSDKSTIFDPNALYLSNS